MELTLWLIPIALAVLLIVALTNAAHRMSEAERQWEQWQRPPDDWGEMDEDEP